MRDQRSADGFAESDDALQRICGNACGVQQFHRLKRDEWRLFGGFCNDRIARDQRRCNLTHENCQRKIPRTDAHPHAAAARIQHVALTRRAWQCDRRADALSLVGVVAQKIYRLTHFGDGVAPGFEGFFHE